MPAAFRPWTAPVALALLGCPPATGPDDSQAPDDTGTPPAGLVAEPVLHVADGPGDLDLDADGQVLIVTRWGGNVLAWNPTTGAQEEVQHAIPDLEGIFRAEDDRLWAASSDGQVEGRVGWIEHNDLVEITDRADDGTLMRGVEDVTLAPDGTLLAVDDVLEGLFLTEPKSGATLFLPLDIANPQGLLFREGTLVVAGSDGIWEVFLPGGAVSRLDARGGRGLALWGTTLLASNATDGVFAVGGGEAGTGGIAGPDDLLALGDTLYISDSVGLDLYAMDLSGWEP